MHQENRRLQTEAQIAEEKAELCRHRELENERAKWERRVGLLMKQLDCQQSTETRPQVSLPRSQVTDDVTSARDNTTPEEVITSNGSETSKEENHQHLGSSQAGEVSLLPHQIPPLRKFSGSDGNADQETWQEWIESFEMVANACQWSDQTMQADPSHNAVDRASLHIL